MSVYDDYLSSTGATSVAPATPSAPSPQSNGGIYSTFLQETGNQGIESPAPSPSFGQNFGENYPGTTQGLADLQIDPLSLKANPMKAIGDAWNALKGAVVNEGKNIYDLVNLNLQKQPPSTPALLGQGAKVLAGSAGVVLSPLSAFFAAANDIPVLGSVSRLLTLPFTFIGDSGPVVSNKIIDQLPISEEAKNQIKPGLGEIFSLAGQLALGGAVGIGEDKIAELTKRFGAQDAQTIVSKAEELANEKQATPLSATNESVVTSTETPVTPLVAQPLPTPPMEVAPPQSVYGKFLEEAGQKAIEKLVVTQEPSGIPASAPRSFSDIGTPDSASALVTTLGSQVKTDLSRIETDPSALTRTIQEPNMKYFDAATDVPAIRSLYAKAPENASELISFLKEKGFDNASVGIKSPESIADKITRQRAKGREYAANPNDVVRASVIVPDEATAEKTLQSFGDKVVKADNYFSHPTNGYRGINTDIRLSDGSLAELQIHTKESLAKAEELHPLYDKIVKNGGTLETPVKTASTTLKPIPGTGEVKVRGLAQGVEVKALQSNLEANFGNLPEYRAVNMADQAKRAVDLIAKDGEYARSIAMGERAAPRGILPESVFTAIENKAIREGDVNTIRDLADSRLVSSATTMGQRIRALAERNPESPTGAIAEVVKAREMAAEKKTGNISEAQEQVTTDIKDEIAKTKPKVTDWNSFIDSLKCT